MKIIIPTSFYFIYTNLVEIFNICIKLIVFLTNQILILNFQYFTHINLYFEAKINEFIVFYLSLYNLCIFYCAAFLVLFLVLNWVNVNVKLIKKFRKLYYYLFILLSTVTSPPDVFSQFFMSLTFVITYEFLVFISLIKI